MIRLLTDLPENVVGAEAVGQVETADYTDVLEPAIAAALARTDKLRLLFILGSAFEGYSAGAAWADTRLGMGHWSQWERIAVVTDRDWISGTVKALSWMLPGDVRVFHTNARDEAIAWVST
jgi:hypothetical protein